MDALQDIVASSEVIATELLRLSDLVNYAQLEKPFVRQEVVVSDCKTQDLLTLSLSTTQGGYIFGLLKIVGGAIDHERVDVLIEQPEFNVREGTYNQRAAAFIRATLQVLSPEVDINDYRFYPSKGRLKYGFRISNTDRRSRIIHLHESLRNTPRIETIAEYEHSLLQNKGCFDDCHPIQEHFRELIRWAYGVLNAQPISEILRRCHHPRERD